MWKREAIGFNKYRKLMMATKPLCHNETSFQSEFGIEDQRRQDVDVEVEA